MEIPREVKEDLNGMARDGEISYEDMMADQIVTTMRNYGYEATPDWIVENQEEFDEHLENMTTAEL
jgi:hypothetical protein